MSEYFVVQLRNVSDSAEDWLSSAAFEFGAMGMSEALPFDQPEGEEDVFTRIPEKRAVDIYFAAAPAREFVENLQSRFPGVSVHVQAEQERDWLAEWKKSFQPFALVDGHWVVPSWCEPPAAAKHKIWIDPGMAFGTGTHETTQLVAGALVKAMREDKFRSALDVGTGTGILAILARQLGIQKIRGTEIEADARRVAKENFVLNKCSDIELDELQVQDLTEQYDLVLANIIDGVLVRLQNELKARVKPGGWMIVSGIIGEREPDFLAGFKLPAGKSWDLREQKRRLDLVRGEVVVAHRRFFVEDMAEDGVRIDGDLFHHIRDVCRFKEGDQFEVLPGNKKAVLVEIVTVSKKELFARTISSRTLPELPKPLITLALSIPKLPKVDWIIEKAVELGVFEIRPFVSDFSFLRKASEVSENRLSRWNKLVTAATQQSGRGDLMRIQPATTLEKLLPEFNRSASTGGLFPYEGQAQQALPQALRELKAKNNEHLWVFVGSEGGFSAREVELFASHGLNPVSLGEQILRVETACLALVSIIKYEYEQFEYGSIR